MIAPAAQTIWAIYRDPDAAHDGLEEWWAELVVGWDENGGALVIDGDCGSGTQLCSDSELFVRLVPDLCRRAAHVDVRRAIALAKSDDLSEVMAVAA